MITGYRYPEKRVRLNIWILFLKETEDADLTIDKLVNIWFIGFPENHPSALFISSNYCILR